jgi:glycosyltransferase involved in cell wall biosynthesis
MKIAVVTAVCSANREALQKSLASVRAQTIPCTHLLINDGEPGFRHETGGPAVEWYQLPQRHNDCGNTSRAIGAASAVSRGFEAVVFLDADYWFEPSHLEQMVQLHRQTRAAVCTAGRNLYDLQGQLLGPCFEVDGESFADTKAAFFCDDAFRLIMAWQCVPKPLAVIGDRLVWKSILDAKISRAHSPLRTVNFRTPFSTHYTYFQKQPPPQAKKVVLKKSAKGELLSAELVGHQNGNGPAISPTVQTGLPSSHNLACKPVMGAKTVHPRVSLCMIVKNEEANLPSCLEPLAGLFHEIIVVDTGSTDNTKECARRWGAAVYDFCWSDNFAAARNESIRHATGDWIFWLDGDERIDEANLQKLKHLLAALPAENLAYMMCQWSAPDRCIGTSLVVDQIRLFRKLPNVKWKYRVHEQILVPLKEQGARDVCTDIVVHHLGYQDAETRSRKRERNTRLLHLELQERPRDAFIYYNLANAHLDASQLEEALGMLRRCLEFATEGASFLPKAYAMLAANLLLLGRDDESLRTCREGKRLFPNAADNYFQEGVLLLGRGDLHGARDCFESILELPLQRNYVGMDPELPKARARHNLAIVYRRLGLEQKAEEQLDLILELSPQFEPGWLALLELYLEQKRQSDAQELLKRLSRNPARSTIEPALLARLSVFKRDIAGARRLLEDALSQNPKAIWLRILFADILLRLANDDHGAELQLREILAIAPNEQQSRRKLTMLLEKRALATGKS